MDAVKFTNLNGGYEDKILFKNLNLAIKKGSFTAIAGPNGSGKTTLLKYLIKELKAENNTVFVLDEDINSLKQKKLAEKLSFVGQKTSLDYEFTVKQVVSMGLYCRSLTSEEQVENALKVTGILHLKDKLITKISGGEAQMVMLARAVCQNTDCIVLDEPVNSLDPKHQLSLLSLLKKFSYEGKTIICVLHDLNAVLSWCDQCILIKDGQIISSGSAESVLTEKNIKDVYEVNCRISQADGRSQITFLCNS